MLPHGGNFEFRRYATGGGPATGGVTSYRGLDFSGGRFDRFVVAEGRIDGLLGASGQLPGASGRPLRTSGGLWGASGRRVSGCG